VNPFSPRNAARKLLERSVTNRYISTQFFGWLLFTAGLGAVDASLAGPASALGVVHRAAAFAIYAGGLFWCYRLSGPDVFVHRFAVLALPISIRLAFAYEVIYWGSYFSYPILANNVDELTYQGAWVTYDFLLSLFMTALWFMRMAYWMTQSSGGTPSPYGTEGKIDG
jgi:hypothetical protein